MISDIGKVISKAQMIHLIKVASFKSISPSRLNIHINHLKWNSKQKFGTQISLLKQVQYV